MRERRLALGLSARECSMSLFRKAGMWEHFEAGDVDAIEAGAVFFFARFLSCRYDELLSCKCEIEQLPEMLETCDSSRVPRLRMPMNSPLAFSKN